jgi:hypothetical protein
MGRHERRASVADFKKAAAGVYLDVYLTPTDAPISNALLERATAYWRGNIQQRRPTCIACKARFGGDACVSAYLCMVPSGAPSTASVSGLCGECWSRLSDDAIKAAALKVGRRVVPTAQVDAQ